MKRQLVVWLFLILTSCIYIKRKPGNKQDSANNDTITVIKSVPYVTSNDALSINTGAITPQQLVAYAKTLIGVPYKYASTDPQQGFDCSGFITYTFNHFNIGVPRSSVDFTDVPNEIPLAEAKPGDLILFTGTDSSIRIVGHMGIIVSNDNNGISFIHSTSGKADGVTITTLNEYYMGRFVKVLRVFPQNDSN